jgi:hypothetical protein
LPNLIRLYIFVPNVSESVITISTLDLQANSTLVIPAGVTVVVNGTAEFDEEAIVRLGDGGKLIIRSGNVTLPSNISLSGTSTVVTETGGIVISQGVSIDLIGLPPQATVLFNATTACVSFLPAGTIHLTTSVTQVNSSPGQVQSVSLAQFAGTCGNYLDPATIIIDQPDGDACGIIDARVAATTTTLTLLLSVDDSDCGETPQEQQGELPVAAIAGGAAGGAAAIAIGIAVTWFVVKRRRYDKEATETKNRMRGGTSGGSAAPIPTATVEMTAR